ncbi:hypothetical protein [Neorhizobium alkalisoli]|uniref:Flagellar assembly protein FliH n=1 Tax=Neorhizobium alkalisoli TaxID=528178 RepID=A0A561QSI8_9HYPH|nr:hypothetical protein [Neorhizobium alkalisoli]TWF53370.1 hypothetical protein FHW37_104649 [Neorhizobium alkalisoli]
MSASLARYLKDFSAPPPPVPVMEDPFADFEPDLPVMPEIPEEPPIDLEAERAEAYAKGQAEATREMQAQWDSDKVAMQVAHEEELNALRKKFEVDLAKTLAGRIQHLGSATATAISEQTAKVLTPILEEAVVTNAVSELATLVNAAVTEGEVSTITVRGPAHLFKKLKATMGSEGPVIKHVESADIDVAVDIADATLVTRLSAWAASLRKVME